MTKEEFEKEVEATIAELPQEPPEDTVSILNARGMLTKELLIYKLAPNHKDVLAKCSDCGKTFIAERVEKEIPWGNQPKKNFYIDDEYGQVLGNGSTGLCPFCGTSVQCVHTSHFNPNSQIDQCYCTGFFEIRGHLCVLSYLIQKFINHSGESFYLYSPYDGTIIINKKFVRVCGMENRFGYIPIKFPWQRRKKYADKVGKVNEYEILSNGLNDIKKTECRKSGLDAYFDLCRENFDFFPLGYLKLWIKFPAVENLARQGFGKILNSIIETTKNIGNYYGSQFTYNAAIAKNYINVKKAKPHEMLGVDKDIIPTVKEWDIKELCFYKLIRDKKGIKLTVAQMQAAKKLGISCLKDLFTKDIHGFNPPVIKTINYLSKMSRINRLICVSYLTDYWEMIFKIHNSLPESMLYPKDLVKSHDRLVLLLKEKENKKLNELISGRFKELDSLSFSDEETGLLIRPCATHSEIIKEGKILIHCVATYAKSYAEGKTAIFFIRKTAEPDIPYYTLELKNGKVAQNRGLRNCARTEDVKAFEEKWLNHIRMVKENDNGKSNNTACA